MKWHTQLGITLIELLLVLAIIALLSAVTLPVGAGFLNRSANRVSADSLLLVLKTAQLNSMMGKAGEPWGVTTANNSITLFAGSSYALRNPAFDEVTPLNESVDISSFEVVFESSGNPQSTPSITVGGQGVVTKTVTLNQYGSIDVN